MKKSKKETLVVRGISEDSQYYADFIKLSNKISSKIRAVREKKGCSQESLAEYGVNTRQLQRIESGETKNITIASLFKISKALKINLKDLF